MGAVVVTARQGCTAAAGMTGGLVEPHVASGAGGFISSGQTRDPGAAYLKVTTASAPPGLPCQQEQRHCAYDNQGHENRLQNSHAILGRALDSI